MPTTIYGNDLRRLLLGIETNVRDATFKFCNIAGNELKTMQFPDFEKASHESYPSCKYFDFISGLNALGVKKKYQLININVDQAV